MILLKQILTVEPKCFYCKLFSDLFSLKSFIFFPLGYGYIKVHSKMKTKFLNSIWIQH